MISSTHILHSQARQRYGYHSLGPVHGSVHGSSLYWLDRCLVIIFIQYPDSQCSCASCLLYSHTSDAIYTPIALYHRMMDRPKGLSRRSLRTEVETVFEVVFGSRGDRTVALGVGAAGSYLASVRNGYCCGSHSSEYAGSLWGECAGPFSR